jgi:uncharacterized protein involved in outer membrane biogenesis
VRAALQWIGIGFGALIVIVVVTLALVDWSAMKGPIERFASERSGRRITIAGPLEVRLWSSTPRVTMSQITIGNPPWDRDEKPMVRIARVHAQLKWLPLLKGDVILPRVELIKPEIYLHREPSGRANWTFENTRPSNAPAEAPPKLPVVRDFLVQNGTLVVHDEVLHLEVNGTVQAHEKGSKADPKAFRIQGKGTINRQPFALDVAGGPLVNLDPDQPYPFDIEVAAGDIRAGAEGRLRKPFDLAHVAFNVRAKGGDLADLYYLTHLALPNTPPFELGAHIERDAKQIRVTQLAGKVGESDLRGELGVDASRKRPTITGNLTSKQLRLKDLAASLGGKPATPGTLQGADEPQRRSRKGVQEPAPKANARLFPTAHLQVERVRAMDADVHFSAQSIQAGSLPLEKVAFHITLDDGALAISPLEFEMPQGKVHAAAHINARGKTPETRLDLRVSDIQLDQLKGKAPDAEPPLGGVVQARATLQGSGDSVHDFMADADGRVSVILPHGEVRAAFAELTGINVARGIGLLLKGDEERAEVRCGVAQFNVNDGVMKADQVVFDTENVRITGRGDIRLGPEELDLSIKGEPKKLRLARIRTPIEISGHLRKPSIGVDAGKTIKQGAIATALATALTPIAAIIAFVDPGLAKDENCAALLASAQQKR